MVKNPQALRRIAKEVEALARICVRVAYYRFDRQKDSKADRLTVQQRTTSPGVDQSYLSKRRPEAHCVHIASSRFATHMIVVGCATKFSIASHVNIALLSGY